MSRPLPPFDGLDVRLDDATRAEYSRDESDMGVFLPDAVVFAHSTQDVVRVYRACAEAGVPVTPVGARSGKSGGSLPVHGGVALCLARMKQVLELSVEDLTAVVQPGVLTGELMRAAEEKGLFYPPDPNSWEYCTLGGNVAENAGGPRALKYGVTRDYVLGLEWVFPWGEAMRLGRRTMKGVAGYDVVSLLVGSEGTLGVATEITFKLLPLPRAVMTALLSFPDVDTAARAVTRVLTQGCLPRCLELLDDVALDAVKDEGFPFSPRAGAVLIVEVDGATAEGVQAELVQVVAACEAAGALESQVALDESQRQKLWAVRRGVSPALRRRAAHKISEDIVVPRSRIPEAIGRFKEAGRAHGLTVATYGHAGDGNLHTNVLYGSPSDRPAVDALLGELMSITLQLGGTITGEHGVGTAKQRFLPAELGPASLHLQRRLQRLLDPAGIANPGKIFPVE